MAATPADPRARGSRQARAVAPPLLVVAWSSGFVGAELAHRAHLRPLTVLAWRFLIVAALLLAACAVTRTSLRSARAWGRQTVLGVLCQFGYLLCVFEGVALGVDGGTTALVAALQPLLVATVAGRLLGEQSTPLAWVGLVLGLAGVAIVVSSDFGAQGAPAGAYLLTVAGMVSLTTGTVLTRRFDPPESLLTAVTMQATVTAVLLAVVLAIAGRPGPPHTGSGWLAVVWLVTISSMLGYGSYVFVTAAFGATTVSTLLYLTPPTTMVWVFLMFGEPITVVGLVGLVVSAAGVALVLWQRRRARAEPDAAAPQPSRPQAR